MTRAISLALLTLSVFAVNAAWSRGARPDPTPPDSSYPVTAPSVIISEVMYAPPSGPEWVELYNPGPTSVFLEGLLLSDDEGIDTNEGSWWFPAGTSLAAGDFLVIGSASAAFVDLVWDRSGPILANTGDEVNLVVDPEHDGLFSAANIIDGFRYASSWGGASGYSLSRTCVSCSSGDGSSWTSSLAVGGTPGADNDTWVAEPTPTPTPAPLPGANKKVLFDAAHCETCGNEEWTITGAYSDFAQELRDLGFQVSSSTAPISSSILSGFDVLIVPEPNTPFTSAEQAAMISFVKAGHGIFMIADHFGSDRNNDGWDSVEVFNGYLSGKRSSANDWLATNFGLRFNEATYSQEPVTNIVASPLTTGVSSVGLFGGTTIAVLDATHVKGVIYLKSTSRGPMVAMVTPATGGRVVAQGDSSTYDDGTCGCGDTLYPNLYDYDDLELGLNSVLWLAGVSQ